MGLEHLMQPEGVEKTPLKKTIKPATKLLKPVNKPKKESQTKNKKIVCCTKLQWQNPNPRLNRPLQRNHRIQYFPHTEGEKSPPHFIKHFADYGSR